ncbi:MAG: acyclic terpene utilization AtuA family protein [Gammaproteobacteria bacterium]|nr:acyclic terpene utilization AtuA family protein [Gammaproteobacteria bacterium]
MATRVLVPAGVLGLGFDSAALARGIANNPDIIAIDGGSTDSGPFYLGTATSKYSRATTKSQWRELMQARAQANVPLVIGSCGTAGTDATVDWMYHITAEIGAESGQRVRVARVYSEQTVSALQAALQNGRLHALIPAPHLDNDALASCVHVVALAGAEQIGTALDSGADIVLAGRATDTATISALPLLRGEHPGAAWHGAKIAECGALCSTHPTSGVVQVEFDTNGFTVAPLAARARCTPHSVSAHMLYENSDPYILLEPGGHLDVSAAQYVALDDKQVRVTGSQWIPDSRYTVKLEGARIAGYQTTMLALLRDPRYVANAREWTARLHEFLLGEIRAGMALHAGEYTLEFRLIGMNAALGGLETIDALPAEVGVLAIITAASQETAAEIASLANPWLLHFPLTEDEELPTFAFPYSPAQTDRGPLYEFCLNHVLELDDPMSAFRLEVDEI